MDDVGEPIPINIDLADDHYDNKESPHEPVHGKPEDGDDPLTTVAPQSIEAPEE